MSERQWWSSWPGWPAGQPLLKNLRLIILAYIYIRLTFQSVCGKIFYSRSHWAIFSASILHEFFFTNFFKRSTFQPTSSHFEYALRHCSDFDIQIKSNLKISTQNAFQMPHLVKMMPRPYLGRSYWQPFNRNSLEFKLKDSKLELQTKF